MGVNAGAGEETPQEGRNYFPLDETAEDVAGFRLHREIDDGREKEPTSAEFAAVIVQSAPADGRELEAGGVPFPEDHSAPDKAGFRLPLPRRKEDEVELDVFIVEGMTEDSGDNDDAFVVVAAPTNPAEEEDDLVVIVGAPDSSRQPKQFESLRRPYQVDCNSPLDRGICQRRSLDQTDVEAFYYD